MGYMTSLMRGEALKGKNSENTEAFRDLFKRECAQSFRSEKTATDACDHFCEKFGNFRNYIKPFDCFKIIFGFKTIKDVLASSYKTAAERKNMQEMLGALKLKEGSAMEKTHSQYHNEKWLSTDPLKHLLQLYVYCQKASNMKPDVLLTLVSSTKLGESKHFGLKLLTLTVAVFGIIMKLTNVKLAAIAAALLVAFSQRLWGVL